MKKNKITKVLLFGWFKNNLGDDSFVSILCNRYPTIEFNLYTKKECASFIETIPNIRIHYKDLYLNLIDISEYDAYIYIGGSIFTGTEEDYQLKKQYLTFIKKIKKAKKEIFFINQNYINSYSKKYLKLINEIFENSYDVCLRDIYSSTLFQNIKTVRYAPDILLCSNFKKEKKIHNSVGIAIMNFENHWSEELKSNYESYKLLIIETIKKLLKNNKTIYLFSFCKYEDKANIFETYLKDFNEIDKTKIKTLAYNKSINEFLKTYSKMEYMICTRFHSLIFSLLCDQKIFVISYGNKTDEQIKSLNLNIQTLDILKCNSKKYISLDNFIKIDKNEITKSTTKAKEHFKKLDKYLKKEKLITKIDKSCTIGKKPIKKYISRIKLILRIFKKNINNKPKIYHEYENKLKINNIKLSVDKGILTKNACTKALMISCEYNIEKANEITDILFKNVEQKEKITLEKEPFVSFVIPTYNRKKELETCLLSILNQEYKNFEIIIVDDNSPDHTDDFIKKEYSKYENIHYYKNSENKGPHFNRKFGFKKSKGEYIIFCDDDDFYIDSLFLKRAAFLLKKYKRNDKVAFISFSAFIYPEKTKLLSNHELNSNLFNQAEEYLDKFLTKYKKPLSTFTTLFSKEALSKSDIENMTMVDDTMIYMRALLSGNAVVSNQIVGMYRVSQNNISSNMSIKFITSLLTELKNISLDIKRNNLNIDVNKWWYDKVISIVNWALNKKEYSFFDLIYLLIFLYTNTPSGQIKIIKKTTKIWLKS